MSALRHPVLLIMSTAEANLLLRRPDAGQISAAISILGAREAELEKHFQNHLSLHFDDADEIETDTIRGLQMLSRLRRRKLADNVPIPVSPTREDVQRVIDFARSNASPTTTLLVHCAGGVSRSPAVAIACLTTWGVPPAQCIQTVQRTRPACQPHKTIVRFADEILRLNGELSSLLNGSNAGTGDQMI